MLKSDPTKDPYLTNAGPKVRPVKKIVIIGAGPAGLMAALQATAQGAGVTLLERNPTAGTKLLLTGKGRCNLTNTALLTDFINSFEPNGKFLYGAFGQFFREDLLDLFARLKVPTTTERGGRVFPASQKSSSVLHALQNLAKTRDVVLVPNSRVDGLQFKNRKGLVVTCQNQTYPADAVIIATGGRSYPGTGSTGDGYELAQQAGHTIVQPLPSLVPLETKEAWPKRLQGLSLKNIELTLLINGQKISNKFGEMIFTHFGVSGPIVLDSSRDLVNQMQAFLPANKSRSDTSIASIWQNFAQQNQISLLLNLKPALNFDQVLQRLQRDFDANGKQYFATILKQLLPSSFIPEIIGLSKIPRDKLGHQITRQEKELLAKCLTALPMTVKGLRSWDEAIITNGGVALDQVNPKTMESKLVKGLYFAGEVLDIDACTGGYNLQAAFSTGWVAGLYAAM